MFNVAGAIVGKLSVASARYKWSWTFDKLGEGALYDCVVIIERGHETLRCITALQMTFKLPFSLWRSKGYPELVLAVSVWNAVTQASSPIHGPELATWSQSRPARLER
jgi:hypothetical protein